MVAVDSTANATTAFEDVKNESFRNRNDAMDFRSRPRRWRPKHVRRFFQPQRPCCCLMLAVAAVAAANDAAKAAEKAGNLDSDAR